MAGTRSWREIRGERPLNEARVREFSRLMAAQEQIATALVSCGLSGQLLDAALVAAEEELPRDEHDPRDFYLPALARYVAALGGRLEPGDTGPGSAPLRAVFPEIEVTIEPSKSG